MGLKLPRLQERGIQRMLTLGFLLVIVFLGVAAIAAVRHSHRIQRAVEQITRDQRVVIRLIHDVQREEDTMVRLLGQMSQRDLAPSNAVALLRQVDETRRRVGQLRAEAKASPQASLWNDLDQRVEAFAQDVRKAMDGRAPGSPPAASPDPGLFARHEEIVRRVDDIVADSAGRLVEMERSIGSQSRDLGDETTLLFTLSLGLSVLCAFFTLRFVDRTLRVMRWQAEELSRVSWHMLQGQEEAARRFSHELHDELGQSLAAIRSNLTQQGHKPPESVRSDCLALVDESIRNVRELSQLLRPVILDDLGLVAGLRWLAERSSERMGIHVEFAANTGERFPEELETHFFRIAQEALTNIARHARAGRVSIRLAFHPPLLILAIEDDGRGLGEPKAPAGQPRGLGMVSMRARARRLGGDLEVGAVRPHGLRIRVEVPFPGAARASGDVASGEAT
jgi:signal transduction histidine kinase